MRFILLSILIVVLGCEKDPSFDLLEIEHPRLDSVISRQLGVVGNAQRLYGRSSGNRDYPVELFFYAADSATDVRFYRASNPDSLASFREFNTNVKIKNGFWNTAVYPLYEGELWLRASYMIADSFYFTYPLKLEHWDTKTSNEISVDIDTRIPTNPRFRWKKDAYNSSNYFVGIADDQEEMLTAVLLSDTSYRFYDVFKPFEYIGPEYTQPELVQDAFYNVYIMGVDTTTGWVYSFNKSKFKSSRE